MTDCPACGEALQPVDGRALVHWLCPACGRCWDLATGGLNRVEPSTCSGCRSQLQVACVEILESDLRR